MSECSDFRSGWNFTSLVIKQKPTSTCFLNSSKRSSRISYSLEWEELPTRRDSRISAYMTSLDPEDELDWPRQHEWLAAKINDFHKVFLARVRNSDAKDWQQDGEIEVSADPS